MRQFFNNNDDSKDSCETLQKYYSNMATGSDLCGMKVNCKVLILVCAVVVSACQRDPYREGARLYSVQCANCHGEQGQGLGALIPPLANADYLIRQRSQLACILVNGLNDTIVVNGKAYYDQQMPANAQLSAIHVTNILNYIGNNWGNHNGEFSLDTVKVMLNRCNKQ